MARDGNSLCVARLPDLDSNRVAAAANMLTAPLCGPAARAPGRTSAILGEMIMYDGLTTGPSHPRGRAMVRGAVAALRKAWTAYTLKRAITDVASMRDEDYRQFGLEKDEILAALERLQDDIEGEGRTAHTAGSPRLAIVVSRRTPRLAARP